MGNIVRISLQNLNFVNLFIVIFMTHIHVYGFPDSKNLIVNKSIKYILYGISKTSYSKYVNHKIAFCF